MKKLSALFAFFLTMSLAGCASVGQPSQTDKCIERCTASGVAKCEYICGKED